MQTDVPEASEMGHSIFIPRAVAILNYFVSQSCMGWGTPPLGVNLQEKWNSILLAFPKVAGDLRGQAVLRIGAG